MPDYEKILYSVDAGVARITLNRPDKRNALDDQLVREVKDGLRRAAADEGARVVLVTGAGKDFCSGADLAALRRISEATVMENVADARNLGGLFIEMRRHPRPIIAAVRGRALAGGCGLATACDIILAAESAQFGYPEVNIGFIPAMVMAILRRSVPEKRAFELITTGEIITARAALDFQLINRVFSDEEFDRSVAEYTGSLARKSASALSLSKSLLYHMDGQTFESAVEAGVQLNAITRMTEDCKRGVERFLKK
ncbi:MAG TPA: enoyl-CoA hydratase-related protein [Blastocatellia bacterium]|nr:enoyl-CoA hydratase-related protein [Blastocatellia bacterium]